jgi:hypothetical protein
MLAEACNFFVLLCQLWMCWLPMYICIFDQEITNYLWDHFGKRHYLCISYQSKWEINNIFHADFEVNLFQEIKSNDTWQGSIPNCHRGTALCIITHNASALLPMMHLVVMSIKHKHPRHWIPFLLVNFVIPYTSEFCLQSLNLTIKFNDVSH